MSPGPWVGVIVVIVIAATAYWWFAARETVSEPPVTGEIAPLPQETVALDEQQTDIVDEAQDVVADEPMVDAGPEPAVEAIAVTDDSAMRMSITYSGDCWTEITDASGRRLFFELGKAGRTVNLSGEAPFNVLFGDAANVSLKVNGGTFEIPAADRRGRTARLTITGS